MDRDGKPYGYVARALDKQVGTKALSMVDSNRGAWYPSTDSKQLLIVEDQLSALRASPYINSVALLGTHMTPGILTEIKKGGYIAIYLALDPDAFPKSIKMAHEIKPSVKTQVVRLPKDVKNMTEEQFLEWMDAFNIAWYM